MPSIRHRESTIGDGKDLGFDDGLRAAPQQLGPRRFPVDLLLDTHIAVWWADDPTRLNDACVEAITAPANTVWFSAASTWELAIKVRSGKIALDIDRLVTLLTANGASLLGIGTDHAIAAGSLDWAHRDPFDRMLVTQATLTSMRIATRDQAIVEHPPRHTLLG